MADQVVDKRTIGIPADIEVVRNDVEEMRDTAESHMDDAQASAAAAQASEAAAKGYEEKAKTLVEEQTGIVFRPDEPAVDSRTDGMLWMVANQTAKKITAFKRWDTTQVGNAHFPSQTTYPSETLYPAPMGAWDDYTLSSALVATI
jgi:hypothetical protein